MRNNGSLSTDTTTKRRPDTLTDREREIPSQLARGANNAEISKALYIGAATAKSHVSSILPRLGQRDRAQAVVFAHEGGHVVAGDHDIGH